MACVTLKRPIDVLGSPHMVEHEPLAKRKRCGPSLFPTTPPGTRFGHGISLGAKPSRSVPQSMSFGRGLKRAKRKLDIDDHYSSPLSSPPSASPFLSAVQPTQTDKLVAQLGQELKRLQRRKTLFSEPSSPTSTSASHTHNYSATAGGSTGNKEQPLFTLKQVTIVCQRMMKEREEEIREQYDSVLSAKLAEQYDAFVKFSHDQVERRLAESAFSYVS